MTRSSSAAAAVAARNAAFLNPSVKRITKGSTCIILCITKESIKCAGCTNVEEKSLKSRVKSASIDSRYYKCRQPWVLRGKTDQCIRIYENTWKELVDELGYPSRKLHNTSSKSRKVPPSFEVSERKKQKLITPPSDQDVEASNLSRSSPTFFGSSSSEALSSPRSPSIEVITTTCEGTAYTTPSTLSDLTQSEGTPSNEPQAGHLLSNILAQNERLDDIVAQNERLEGIVAGLSIENKLMSSRLQMARATNSQLQQDQEEELSQQQEAMAISKFDVLTNRSHHAKYKNGHEQFKKIMHQSTGRGNYFGTPLGKKLYAHAAALSPQNSFKNLEMILALNQAAFLVDSGVELRNIDLKKIAKTVPSASTLKEFVIDSATDSAFQAWDEIVQHNCKLFLLCDKGAKKTANAHFVKILCWWSTLDKKIKTFNMDSNDTDGTSKACAHAIQHALFQLFGGQDNILAILFGQATDSGGGGIGSSFHTELTKLGLSSATESYLKSFCTLHCIQLTLQNPISRVLGQGGLGKDGRYKTNAIQALHGLHNLQKHQEKTNGR